MGLRAPHEIILLEEAVNFSKNSGKHCLLSLLITTMRNSCKGDFGPLINICSILKNLKGGLSPTGVQCTSEPFWIKVHNLPFSVGERIGSAIGNVITMEADN